MFRPASSGAFVAMLMAVQYFIGPRPSEAAVIAQDNFDSYLLGSIVDQGTAGDGWGGAYSGLNSTSSFVVPLRDVVADVLPGFGQSLEVGFSAVPTSGSGTRNNSNIVQRVFDEQADAVYFGFALQTANFDDSPLPGTGNQDFFQFYVNNTSNDAGTTGSQSESLSIGIDYIGVTGGTAKRFFARKGTGTVANNSFDHANDTLYSMVFRVSKSGGNGGNYDQIALFIDQPSEGTPDAIRGEFDENNLAPGSLTVISRMHLRITGLDLGDRVYLDNLRIATTYAEAVPSIPIPGDFNSDGNVDGTDFVAWQSNFPLASGATLAQGDADGDGDVDGADFVVWQTNFPFTASAGASPVPEPAAIWPMLAVAALCIARMRRIHL